MPQSTNETTAPLELTQTLEALAPKIPEADFYNISLRCYNLDQKMALRSWAVVMVLNRDFSHSFCILPVAGLSLSKRKREDHVSLNQTMSYLRGDMKSCPHHLRS